MHWLKREYIQFRECEGEVIATLQDLLRKRMEYSMADGEQFFNAEQNARLVTNAERYYRTMYYAENNSWNQRDQHMFDTLQSVLAFRGPQSVSFTGLRLSYKATTFMHRCPISLMNISGLMKPEQLMH